MKDIKNNISNLLKAMDKNTELDKEFKDSLLNVISSLVDKVEELQVNVETLDEKIIDARFNKVTKNKYYTELLVYTSSSENILFDIMQAVNNINIQVESMNIISKSSYYVYLVTLFVNNTTEIDKCIKEINKVKHVTETIRKVD